MRDKHRFLSIFAVFGIVMFSVVAMPVSASYGGNNNIANGMMQQAGNSTQTPKDTTESVIIELSGGTDLVDYTFDAGNSTVTLHFRSEYRQPVVITDAFIPPDSGMQEINQRRIMVKGEKTVTFHVTKVSGKMGVTLQAGGGDLYGVVESVGFSLNAKYSAEQVVMLIIAGMFCGVTLVLGAAYKRKLKNSEEIEKVL